MQASWRRRRRQLLSQEAVMIGTLLKAFTRQHSRLEDHDWSRCVHDVLTIFSDILGLLTVIMVSDTAMCITIYTWNLCNKIHKWWNERVLFCQYAFDYKKVRIRFKSFFVSIIACVYFYIIGCSRVAMDNSKIVFIAYFLLKDWCAVNYYLLYVFCIIL